MIDNMDEYILQYIKTFGQGNCPEMAKFLITIRKENYTDDRYQTYLKRINRHMKTLEKYGIVRYTGRTVSSSLRAKIWELDINEE